MRVEKYPLLVKATRLKAVAAFGNSHQQSKVARFGRALAAVALPLVALGGAAPMAVAQIAPPTSPPQPPPPPPPPPPSMSGEGGWRIVSAKATRSGTGYTWSDEKNMMVDWPMDENHGAYTDSSILPSPTDPSPDALLGGSSTLWGAVAKQGQTAKASQDFDITVKIQWSPGYGKTLQTDPAPDKASLLVSSRVGVYSRSVSAPDFSANNGLDSPAKEIPSSFTETGDYKSKWFQSRGLVLVPVSVSGGQGEVTFKLHGNGAATAVSKSDGSNADITFDATFGARPDKRTLTISRGVGAKKWNDPSLNKDHDEWVEANGTGHGHSRWSYTERISTPTILGADYTDHPVPLYGFITAQPGGAWSNNLTGVWSNPDVQDRQPPRDVNASHAEFLPDGGALLNSAGLETGWGGASQIAAGWYGTPSTGTEPTVTYKLTDNGSGTPVTATAKYVFHLHDEWEKGVIDTPAETTRTGTWVVGGWSSHTGAGTHEFQWNFTEEHEVTLTTNFGADFKAQDWLNIGGKLETSSKFKANVVTGASVTLKGGEKARPYMRYTIRTQHKLVDHYVVAGFDRNQGRTDGKWPKSADLPLSIPGDIEALWQGPLQTSDANPGDPT